MMEKVLRGRRSYAFEVGDSAALLRTLPEKSIDCVITSPPYWQQRIYEDYDGEMENVIGFEPTPEAYVEDLMKVIREVARVLKPTGTFWLNIGDKFWNKCLMGMPWRVALAMEQEGWILRSDVIWDQMKGTQSCKDRFRDLYEHVFQFVRSGKYTFDADAIRIVPEKDPYEREGEITSATGVTGKKYFAQIKGSEVLSEEEKQNALAALEETLEEMRRGEVVDFRMTVRGEQRAYHSESKKISGRAKELCDKGYYIMKMRKKGFLPSNIWRLVPEDTWRKDAHCAVFPEELLRIPILATCPPDGVVLDPFSGTGSAVDAAVRLGRRGIGIDLSRQYTEVAERRLQATVRSMAAQKRKKKKE